MNKRLVVLIALSTLLFYPAFTVIAYSSEYLGGFRDYWMFSVRYFTNFEIYSTSDVFNANPLLSYVIIYLFYSLLPWDCILFVSIIVFYILNMFTVYLLYSLFKKYKYAFLLVPLFYFSIPPVEYANLLLITFLVLAFHFLKKRPYVAAIFLSLSLFTKQYALIPVFLLLIYPLFKKGFTKRRIRLFLIQLLIVVTPHLIAYFPFGYSSAFNRMVVDAAGMGFNFFDINFTFLFPMLALIVLTSFLAFKHKDKLLFSFLAFYVFMYFFQSKLGANLYYSVITPFLLFQYYRSKSKGFNYLFFVLIIAFYLAFIGLHANFIFIGGLQSSFNEQFRSVPDNTVFSSLNGVHPLLLSKSAFDSVVIRETVSNHSSYDNLFLNIHPASKGFNGSGYNDVLLTPISGCVFCNHLATLATRNETLIPYFKNYYENRISELCLFNPGIALIFFEWYEIGAECSNSNGLLEYSIMFWNLVKWINLVLFLLVTGLLILRFWC